MKQVKLLAKDRDTMRDMILAARTSGKTFSRREHDAHLDAMTFLNELEELSVNRLNKNFIYLDHKDNLMVLEMETSTEVPDFTGLLCYRNNNRMIWEIKPSLKTDVSRSVPLKGFCLV